MRSERERPDGKGEVAKALCVLGNAQEDAAQLEDALESYDESRRLYEAEDGADSTNVAATLNNMAIVNQKQCKYDAAMALYERALAILEAKLGKCHPEVAGTLNSMAIVKQEQGKYDAAMALYERALAIDEAKLGSFTRSLL